MGQGFKTLKEQHPELSDQFWRLNNLYWIIDEHSNRVKFKMRPPQLDFWNNKWFWNEILKSRQHGFSTLIDLMALDTCLFNANIEAGIIAHTKEAIQHIFATKIKYPYENLPEGLRDRIPALKCDANELRLGNNSWLRVALSMRSSTLRFLHISERGKICAKYPQKAEELKTGTIPTLHEGSYLFDESTAEGGAGDFYDACMQSQADTAQEKEGAVLNPKQCRFHFYAWHDDPKNATDPGNIIVSDELKRYLKGLRQDHGIELNDRQKAWYALTRDGAQGLGRLMKREHPSYPAEAFEQSVEGAVFGDELDKCRNEGRIAFVPYQENHLVYTFWDLGVGHPTCIIFCQFISKEVRIIDYHEEAGHGITYHCDVAKKKPYHYGGHYLPHDSAKRDQITGEPLYDTVEQLLGMTDDRTTDGISTPSLIHIVQRCKTKAHSIEAARQIFPSCWIDAKKCVQLIKCLSFYRYEWDDDAKKFSKEPTDDWAADGADAFQGLGMTWMTIPIGKEVLGGFQPIPVRATKQANSYDYNPWEI